MASDQAMIHAAREVETMRARLKRGAEAHKKEIEKVTEVGIATVTCGGLAYMDARYPDRMQVAKIPASAIIGGGIVLGSLAGVVPDDPKIFAVGLGAACAYTAKLGSKKGADAKATADQKSQGGPLQ